MATKPKAKKTKRKELETVELVDDAWPRFEKFVRDVAKAGPQHREAPKARRKKSRSK